MLLSFESLYVNSLEKAVLRVEFYVGFPKLPGILVFNDPPVLAKSKFKFDLSGPDTQAWLGNGKTVSTDNMATFLAKGLMDYEDQQRAAFPTGS